MNTVRRRVIILLVGILLVVLPFLGRMVLTEYRVSSYRPPEIGQPDLATTPEPTSTGAPVPQDIASAVGELKAGPVVVDLAHFNLVSPSQFQSLATRLATHGIGLRFWMNPATSTEVDTMNLAGLPDQSEALAQLLQDATGLVVVSPLFLWKQAEISIVEKFVADGGRLLLISDPDIPEVPDYYTHDLNKLGEPFGVVFNDDYLYDLSHNDRNFTHLFQAEFLDRAAELKGKTIVLYGVRSLSGPVISQAHTADTALSSLRTGLTRFTTVAIGGQEANKTFGKVLAMGDFDVLTEPYVSRYDNRLLLDFVSDFLAGARRGQLLADFPAYLGPRVALTLGEGISLDAQLLAQISQVQQKLEETGRTLMLVSSADYALTDTLMFTHTLSVSPTSRFTAALDSTDLIYLASFDAANEKTALLSHAGIRLADITATPEAGEDASEEGPVAADAPVAGTEPSPTASHDETPEANVTNSPLPTPAATSTPAPTPTPATTKVIETDFAPRLLADQSVFIMKIQSPDGKQVTAVLGNDIEALGSALDRLLARDFSDCVAYPDLLLCPRSSSADEVTPSAEEPAPTSTSASTTAEATPQPGTTETPDSSEASEKILLVDDDRTADPQGANEAAFYRQTLNDLGYAPTSWSTATDGNPGEADLAGYDWVVWSSGAYQAREVEPEALAALALYLDEGGHMTISGRAPVLGQSDKEPSAIADVTVTDQVLQLVVGLSGALIQLESGLPPAVPLKDAWGENSSVVLRRGPKSADSGIPLMVALEDTAEPDGAVPRAIVSGMPINWLPEADAIQLVRNMAAWMLNE